MIDINLIRDNISFVKKSLLKKGDFSSLVDEVFLLDKKYREKLTELENKRSEQKKISEEIAKSKDKSSLLNKVKDIKEHIKALESEVSKLKDDLDVKLSSLPNLPDEDALVGKGEEDNKTIKEVFEIPKFDFQIKDHLDLSEYLDLADVKKASEVAGSRFYYLKNEAVLLEFALVFYTFNFLLKEGFIPVVPPVMIKKDMYMKMGRLLGGQEEERYKIEGNDLYLVGSAEHTIGPIHNNYIFDEEELPKRYVGFSSCFRKEAGSYGKDVRGFLRTHQFDKIEMFSFSHPERSKDEHEFLLSMQEKLVSGLQLPYRVVEVCTGDMGFTDAKQFDIEVWIPSQGKYRETHSCSNTTDFQARGINAKFKNKKTGKNEFVHMLNATGFAIGRILIAIFENYQQSDGSILIPEALQKYSFGMKKISKNK